MTFSGPYGVALAEPREPDLPDAPAIEVGSSRTELRPEAGSRVLVVEDAAPLAQTPPKFLVFIQVTVICPQAERNKGVRSQNIAA